MRGATILVARLKGTATEVIKNIVLAGIGKLIVVDDADVSEEDLGAGFFFRDEDVGKKVSVSLLLDFGSDGLSMVNLRNTTILLAHRELTLRKHELKA